MKRTILVTLAVILGGLNGFASFGMAAGPPATVAVWTGTPQSSALNSIFQVRLVARVTDSMTNGVPNVMVTFAAPASGASASFGGSATATVVTDSSGAAIAPTMTANGQAGSYTVTASVPGLATPAIYSLTNTVGGGGGGGGNGTLLAPINVRVLGSGPGSVSVSAVAGTLQSVTVNAAFATPLQASVRDSSNNPVAGVVVTFVAPGSGPSASFSGAITATATTNTSGVASAPTLTANGQGGSYLVRASVDGAATAATFTLTNWFASGGSGVGAWTNITPPEVPQGGSGGNNCDYGTLAFVLDPSNPSTIYLGTCEHGVFKTTNSGDSWTHVNNGANGAILDRSRQWTFAIDPVDPRILYTNSGYGGGSNNGAWKSVNGGVDWQKIWPSANNPELANIVQYDFVAQVALDPTDRRHVFLSWHGVCAAPYTPVCYGESKDAGATWIMHNGDPRWQPSEAQTIYIVDANRWLFANHADGLWRTSDAGLTWTLINSQAAGHWPSQLYKASNGVFYIGADNGIYRSPDFTNWSVVPQSGSLVNGIAGDGTTLYAAYYGALTPWVPVGTNPYVTSPETDGMTWLPAPWPVPAGMFTQGSGGGFAYDRVNRMLYSSNGTAGMWRVKTQ